MSGYFGEETLTRDVLSPEGWLNTGDLAYLVDGSIVITGRQKDLIIINGRNIWPQDLEYIAESQPEVRTGDASAFSVTAANGEDKAVLVIECRETNPARRDELVGPDPVAHPPGAGHRVLHRAGHAQHPAAHHLGQSSRGRAPKTIFCSGWPTGKPSNRATATTFYLSRRKAS
jgi:hypothetical protein